LVGACLALLAPLDARAQSAEAQAQHARIDSLIPEWRAANRAVLMADSVRRARRLASEQEPLDTLVLPAFMIVARHKQAAETFAAFRAAVRRRGDMLEGIPRDRHVTLLVQWEVDRYRTLELMSGRPRHRLVSLYGVNPDRRRRSAFSGVDGALVDFLSPSVRAWLADPNLLNRTDRAHVYRELATSSSAHARGCFRRDPSACLAALELNDTPDPTRGYTIPQLQHFVRRVSSYHEAPRATCLQRGELASCLESFKSYGGPPLPLGRSARASLVMFALERGRKGSLARMAGQSDATPVRALAAAAGMPPEELIRAWRDDVDQHRHVTRAGLPGAALAALFWSLVALLVALRSTRRRAE
jgi:hypothetical protein